VKWKEQKPPEAGNAASAEPFVEAVPELCLYAIFFLRVSGWAPAPRARALGLFGQLSKK
jgi:hypothetical protein